MARMYSDEIAAQANEDSRKFGDRLFEVNRYNAERKRLKPQENMEMAKSMVAMQEAGYNYDPQKNTISPSEQFGAVPAGFVRVGGKYEKDPSYISPKDQADIDYKRNMSGAFGGGTAGVDANGEPIATLTPQQRLSMLAPEDQANIKGLTEYTTDPNIFSKRGNKGAQMVGLAKSIDPSFDMTQYPTRSKYRAEVSSGKVGANVRGFNTAIQHLGELNRATGKVPSNPIKPIEQMQRFGAKTFRGNSPEALGMQEEETALTAVSGELANIFKNSGGTDQEIEKWFAAYDKDAPKEAKRQFIKTGIELMKGRLGALETDYTRVMGKPNPNPYMSKDSEGAINEMFGGGSKFGAKGGSVAPQGGGDMVTMTAPDGSKVPVHRSRMAEAQADGLK